MQTGPILVPAGAERGMTEEIIARARAKKGRERQLRQEPELAIRYAQAARDHCLYGEMVFGKAPAPYHQMMIEPPRKDL